MNLYFRTLQPLEFTEIDSELIDEETQEEETGVKMSDDTELTELHNESFDEILEYLQPANLDETEWEFVDKRDVHDDMISDEDWATICIEAKENLFTELKNSVIPNKPKQNRNTFSVLDKSFYRVH